MHADLLATVHKSLRSCDILSCFNASLLFQEAKGDYVRYVFFSCLNFGDAIHKVLDAIEAFECPNAALFAFGRHLSFIKE